MEIITISDCEKDGRAKIIEITKIGREKLHSVMEGYYDIINQYGEQNDKKSL